MFKNLILISFISLLFVVTSQSLATDAPVYYQVGDTLNSANLTSISGELVTTQSFSKRILFINFFASW